MGVINAATRGSAPSAYNAHYGAVVCGHAESRRSLPARAAAGKPDRVGCPRQIHGSSGGGRPGEARRTVGRHARGPAHLSRRVRGRDQAAAGARSLASHGVAANLADYALDTKAGQAAIDQKPKAMSELVWVVSGHD